MQLTCPPHRYWSDINQQYGHIHSHLISWLPPPLEVKLTFDASIISNKGYAGYVIKDHNTKVLQAGSKLLQHSPVPFAKLTAAWLGLQAVVHHMQAAHIWLEGHSFTVVAWLIHPSRKKYVHTPLFKDLWECTLSNSCFEISHTLRQANQQVDYLTNKAMQGNFDFL